MPFHSVGKLIASNQNPNIISRVAFRAHTDLQGDVPNQPPVSLGRKKILLPPIIFFVTLRPRPFRLSSHRESRTFGKEKKNLKKTDYGRKPKRSPVVGRASDRMSKLKLASPLPRNSAQVTLNEIAPPQTIKPEAIAGPAGECVSPATNDG